MKPKPKVNDLPTIEEYQERLNSHFSDLWAAGIGVGENFGDLFPIQEWLAEVNSCSFIDYDGHGFFAMIRADGKTIRSNMNVRPSDITKWKIKIPVWATHVLWYNR